MLAWMGNPQKIKLGKNMVGVISRGRRGSIVHVQRQAKVVIATVVENLSTKVSKAMLKKLLGELGGTGAKSRNLAERIAGSLCCLPASACHRTWLEVSKFGLPDAVSKQHLPEEKIGRGSGCSFAHVGVEIAQQQRAG